MPSRVLRTPEGSVRVVSPHGVKASSTTHAKAKQQVRRLHALNDTPGVKPRNR